MGGLYVEAEWYISTNDSLYLKASFIQDVENATFTGLSIFASILPSVSLRRHTHIGIYRPIRRGAFRAGICN